MFTNDTDTPATEDTKAAAATTELQQVVHAINKSVKNIFCTQFQ